MTDLSLVDGLLPNAANHQQEKNDPTFEDLLRENEQATGAPMGAWAEAANGLVSTGNSNTMGTVARLTPEELDKIINGSHGAWSEVVVACSNAEVAPTQSKKRPRYVEGNAGDAPDANALRSRSPSPTTEASGGPPKKKKKTANAESLRDRLFDQAQKKASEEKINIDSTLIEGVAHKLIHDNSKTYWKPNVFAYTLHDTEANRAIVNQIFGLKEGVHYNPEHDLLVFDREKLAVAIREFMGIKEKKRPRGDNTGGSRKRQRAIVAPGVPVALTAGGTQAVNSHGVRVVLAPWGQDALRPARQYDSVTVTLDDVQFRFYENHRDKEDKRKGKINALGKKIRKLAKALKGRCADEDDMADEDGVANEDGVADEDGAADEDGMQLKLEALEEERTDLKNNKIHMVFFIDKDGNVSMDFIKGNDHATVLKKLEDEGMKFTECPSQRYGSTKDQTTRAKAALATHVSDFASEQARQKEQAQREVKEASEDAMAAVTAMTDSRLIAAATTAVKKGIQGPALVSGVISMATVLVQDKCLTYHTSTLSIEAANRDMALSNEKQSKVTETVIESLAPFVATYADQSAQQEQREGEVLALEGAVAKDGEDAGVSASGIKTLLNMAKTLATEFFNADNEKSLDEKAYEGLVCTFIDNGEKFEEYLKAKSLLQIYTAAKQEIKDEIKKLEREGLIDVVDVAQAEVSRLKAARDRDNALGELRNRQNQFRRSGRARKATDRLITH